MNKKYLLNGVLGVALTFGAVVACTDDSADDATANEAFLRGGNKADGGVPHGKDKDAGKDKPAKPDAGDDDSDAEIDEDSDAEIDEDRDAKSDEDSDAEIDEDRDAEIDEGEGKPDAESAGGKGKPDAG